MYEMLKEKKNNKNLNVNKSYTHEKTSKTSLDFFKDEAPTEFYLYPRFISTIQTF